MPDYVAKLQKELRKLAREEASKVARQSGLAQSSVENGPLPVNDADGNRMSQLGAQDDGSYAPVVFSGPVPPLPSEPVASGSNVGAFTAWWDGQYADALIGYNDFKRVEVHVTGDTDAALVEIGPASTTKVGEVTSAAGGYVTTKHDAGDFFVWLVAWSQAGKFSAPSGPVPVHIDLALNGSNGDIVVGGNPLLGTMADPNAAPGALDVLPRGAVQAYSFRDLSVLGSTITLDNAAALIGQFEIALPAGRSYRFEMPWRVNPSLRSGSTNQGLDFSIRAWASVTTDGTEPPDPQAVDGNQIADSSARAAPAGTRGVSGVLTAAFPTGAAARCKILLGIYTTTGMQLTPSTFAAFDWTMTVSDQGPATSIIGAADPGAGSQQRFTSVWVATDCRSWDHNGNTLGSPAVKSLLYQGVSPSASGLQHSAFVCNGAAVSGEVGKTITQALTGATVTQVRAGLQAHSWEKDKGELQLRKLTGTTLATTDSGNPSVGPKFQYDAAGQFKWNTLPNPGWVGPGNTGLYLDTRDWQFPNSHGTFEGTTASSGMTPRLEITYVR